MPSHNPNTVPQRLGPGVKTPPQRALINPLLATSLATGRTKLMNRQSATTHGFLSRHTLVARDPPGPRIARDVGMSSPIVFVDFARPPTPV